MAIQKSVLCDAEIVKLLQNSYGISVDRVQQLALGTANCRKIFAGDKAFFFKEYQETFSEQDLRRETALNEFLLSKSFPTAGFVEDKNGNKYNCINNRYIVVQNYIDGESYVKHDLPDNMLFLAAEMLGQLHEILNEYELQEETDTAWVDGFNLSKTAAEYDFLINRAEEIEDKEIRDRIKEDIIFKRELLYVIEPYRNFFDKLTYKFSHGDYCAMQYLCSGDKIKAVIDFATAKKIPAVWEIMRSYMQSAKDTGNPFEFDVSKFCRYVRCYMQFSRLSEWDLKYMPYIYLYQLGRSRYGYREYMMNVENKDALLKFAFWRTDICRMLLDKKDVISQFLLDDIGRKDRQ
ncbi:MAG: phosphotransferase [Lachnospiraceae bacterium]|nr:phosphotransferase [Lachnospiraceae bacterium]